MTAYTLTVCHEGQPLATETIYLATAAQVLSRIPQLLTKHPDCHRIHVHTGGTRLFSVDCNGQTVTDQAL